MDQKILWAVNQMPKTDDKNLPIMGLEEIAKARTFHESFPQYTKTPLTKLDHMAAYLGVKEIYLKMSPTVLASMHSRFWEVPSPWPATLPRKPAGTYPNFPTQSSLLTS